MGFHIGIFLPHFGKDLIPEHHGIVQGIPLGDAGEGFVFLPGQIIGIADDPFRAEPGEHTVLDHHFPGGILVQPGTGAGIFPFAVFPDKDHVDVLPLHAGQGTGSPFQQLHRPQVHIFIEALADFDQKAPERDVVRHPGIPHSPQVDGIETGQLFDTVLRHHFPVFQVILAAPGKIGEIKSKGPVQFRRPVQYLDAFRQHFWPDAVSSDYRNFVDLLFHCRSFFLPGSKIPWTVLLFHGITILWKRYFVNFLSFSQTNGKFGKSKRMRRVIPCPLPRSRSGTSSPPAIT